MAEATALQPGTVGYTDERPWGSFTILADEHDHKIKRIVIHPQKRLSLQRHKLRAEHWCIIRGQALVTLNGRELLVKTGETVSIPREVWHRVKNPCLEELVFIEVQTGDYFGEDDIERLEDDFGRV